MAIKKKLTILEEKALAEKKNNDWVSKTAATLKWKDKYSWLSDSQLMNLAKTIQKWWDKERLLNTYRTGVDPRWLWQASSYELYKVAKSWWDVMDAYTWFVSDPNRDKGRANFASAQEEADFKNWAKNFSSWQMTTPTWRADFQPVTAYKHDTTASSGAKGKVYKPVSVYDTPERQAKRDEISWISSTNTQQPWRDNILEDVFTEKEYSELKNNSGDQVWSMTQWWIKSPQWSTTSSKTPLWQIISKYRQWLEAMKTTGNMANYVSQIKSTLMKSGYSPDEIDKELSNMGIVMPKTITGSASSTYNL